MFDIKKERIKFREKLLANGENPMLANAIVDSVLPLEFSERIPFPMAHDN